MIFIKSNGNNLFLFEEVLVTFLCQYETSKSVSKGVAQAKSGNVVRFEAVETVISHAQKRIRN